jgi:hypothetical protein
MPFPISALCHLPSPAPQVLANGPGDPTWLRLVSEVSIGVFLYDMLFYPFHW